MKKNNSEKDSRINDSKKAKSDGGNSNSSVASKMFEQQLNISLDELRSKMNHKYYVNRFRFAAGTEYSKDEAIKTIKSKPIVYIAGCNDILGPEHLLAYNKNIKVFEAGFVFKCDIMLDEILLCYNQKSVEKRFFDSFIYYNKYFLDFFAFYPELLNDGVIGQLAIITKNIEQATKNKDRDAIINYCKQMGDIIDSYTAGV